MQEDWKIVENVVWNVNIVLNWEGLNKNLVVSSSHNIVWETSSH